MIFIILIIILDSNLDLDYDITNLNDVYVYYTQINKIIK
jgi:hypothetical protein